MTYDFEQMRRAMVASQLRATGVDDPRVVAAMGEVPRERFVPPDRASIAYADALVPLKPGRQLNPPMAIGRLLSEAAPVEGERAMVIGAATGYSAAVLARLVGSVTAVEEDDELAAQAMGALAGTGVKLVEGPLARGHEPGAPYDLILIDGAVELVPQTLVAQVREGGRIAAAMHGDGVTRLCLGRRAGNSFGMVSFTDSAAAILPGFERPKAFTF